MENNNLRKLRQERKITLRELETQTGINFTTIGQLERGEMELTPKYLEIFAEFYDVSYEYLLNKTRENLQEMNLPPQKIEEALASVEFKNSLQKQVICLMTLLRDEDLDTINEMAKHMLRRINIKYKQILREKYLIENVEG